MHRDVLARRAAVLADCTGLTHAQARQHLQTAPPHAALIPEPTAAQALLERWVLCGLARPVSGRLYPWGIRRVWPYPEHLDLELEGDHVARETVDGLFPRVTGDGDVHGVPGLRVAEAGREGIGVWLGGSPASVTLHGIRSAAWHRAVQEAEDEDELTGEHLRHREADWTEAEHTCLTDVELLGERADLWIAAGAWLPSGLLRRIGLLRAVGVPVSADAWSAPIGRVGERLVAELLMEEPPRLGHHQRLAELLTSSAVGIPLTVAHEFCQCSQMRLPRSCYLDLVGNGGREALQLRFTRTSARTEPEEALARRRAWKPLRTLGRERGR